MVIIFYFLSSFVANFALSYKNKNYFKFSCCDYCNQKVQFNIPIFSGLFKTKCCNKNIIHYSIKELLIFIISIWLYSYSIHYVITFYLLFIISEYDFLTYEISYFIFLILIIYQLFTFKIFYFPYFISLILTCFSLKNKLGFGDVVFISCTSLFVENIALYLLMSCIIGLIWIKKAERIPFLPALSIAYLTCLILQRI